ncbi:glycosyltransferase family 87 protein [Acidobacteriota bacterium]
MRIKKKAAIILLLVFALSILIFLFKIKDEMHDFDVNYIAGKRLRWAETLYRFDDGHYMFKYLPSSAFLYLPLSYLPLDVAKAIWYYFVLIAFALILYLSYRLLPKNEKSIYLLILPPLILFRFFLRELALGQINALMTVVLLLMIWNLLPNSNKDSSKRELLAGFLWGLGIAMKPYAVIFLPYLIIKRRWRALLSGFIFLGGAVLSPAIFYGLQGNFVVLKEWYSTLSKSTPGLLATADNISIIGFFTKWTGNTKQSMICSAIVISLLAIMVLVLILKGKDMSRAPVLECSLCLLLIPLVSPLGWDYTLLMSTLAIMIIIQRYPYYSKLYRIVLVFNFALIFLSTYDLLGRELYSTIMLWSVTTINFLILIGYLAHLRLKKIY